MNRISLIGLGLVCTLAACGGGGGSPSPVPIINPTQQPTQTPVQYTSQLVFVGALSGKTVQSDIRTAQVATDAATPLPIMVVSAPMAGAQASEYGGQVEAVVSPMPTASPSVSFSNTNSAAVLSSPSPQPLPTGVIAEAIVNGANGVQVQQAGTAAAAIGSPVNQQPSAPVYSYMSIALDMTQGPGGIAGLNYTPHHGWQWNGSTWVVDDTQATADIYIDKNGIVYVPGGDVRVSTDTAFNSIAASQWTNAETSFTLTQANAQNPDGSNNGLVIGKTQTGHIFKLFPNAINTSEGYFGAIEVSGASVDGF